jgi:hypothetical protein
MAATVVKVLMFPEYWQSCGNRGSGAAIVADWLAFPTFAAPSKRFPMKRVGRCFPASDLT